MHRFASANQRSTRQAGRELDERWVTSIWELRALRTKRLWKSENFSMRATRATTLERERLSACRLPHSTVFGGCFSEVLLRYEQLPFASQSVRLAVVRHGRRHESNPVWLTLLRFESLVHPRHRSTFVLHCKLLLLVVLLLSHEQ